METFLNTLLFGFLLEEILNLDHLFFPSCLKPRRVVDDQVWSVFIHNLLPYIMLA